MKYRIALLLLGNFIFITSCHNTSEKYSRLEISVIKALNYSGIKISDGRNEIKGQELNYLNLDIQSDIVDISVDRAVEDSSRNEVASIAALVMYMHMDSFDVKENKAIKVRMLKDIDGSQIKFEKMYYLDTLEVVSNAFKKCDFFCKNIIKQTYKENFNLLNSHLKDKVGTVQNFCIPFENADKELGEVINYKIVGFNIQQGQYINPGSIKVIHFTVELYRRGMVNYMDLDFGYMSNYSGITSAYF
jgi:hypothetical protein